MPAVGALARRVKSIRPVADELREAQQSASEGGLLAVLPGDIPTADRLRELLGAPSTSPPAGEGLLIHPAVEGADAGGPARALLAHDQAGGRTLALLIGAADARGRLERAFGEAGVPVRMMAHTPSLTGRGAGLALDAIVRALGDEAPAAARRLPRLRPTVSEMLIAGAARRAAAVAAAPLASIDMPVLSLIQVRLATQLAVAHDQTLGPERAPELAPILLGGYGWRALSRLAQMRLPAPALVRGAIAAVATVGVGAGAEAWYRSRNVPGSMDELRELVEGAVRRRAAS